MTDSPAPVRKRRVLSVDDDPRIRSLIELYLGKEGYEVHSAPSALEGLKILPTVRPDLILLDVMMPGMNGYETCARLQEKPDTAEIPVIFVTSLLDRSCVQGCIRRLTPSVEKPGPRGEPAPQTDPAPFPGK